MTQLNIYLDDIDNMIIDRYSKIWNLSKPDTIKRMIKEFEKDKGGHNGKHA